MSNPKAEVYVLQMKMMAKATLAAAAKVPEGKRLHQTAEGKAHPLWTMGHLTWSLGVIDMGIILGKKPTLPREWSAFFGPALLGANPIVPDAGQYPSWDEIVKSYGEVAEDVIAGVAALTDEELPGPVKGSPPDDFKDMFRTIEISLTGMIAHDAHHRGQMALLAES